MIDQDALNLEWQHNPLDDAQPITEADLPWRDDPFANIGIQPTWGVALAHGWQTTKDVLACTAQALAIYAASVLVLAAIGAALIIAAPIVSAITIYRRFTHA